MTPEGGLARLLGALDRLPRGARRLLALMIPALLLGALVAAFALATARERRSQRSERGGAARAQTMKRTPRPTRDPAASRDVGQAALSAAIDPARRFVEGYLAYAYGLGRLSAIPDADPQLLRALAGQRARVPPAAARRRPRVSALRVTSRSPRMAQATATATVAGASAVQYALVFLLERRAGRWTVTEIPD